MPNFNFLAIKVLKLDSSRESSYWRLYLYALDCFVVVVFFSSKTWRLQVEAKLGHLTKTVNILIFS